MSGNETHETSIPGTDTFDWDGYGFALILGGLREHETETEARIEAFRAGDVTDLKPQIGATALRTELMNAVQQAPDPYGPVSFPARPSQNIYPQR